MPNYFKQASPAVPATVPTTAFEPVVKGKPGWLGRLRLRHREDNAKVSVQTAAIDAIEREALATVKNAVEAQGQELRSEHARVHAQILAAIGAELTANAAAGYQQMADIRMGATFMNFNTRSEWVAEIERMASAGNISAHDKDALVSTACALHMETEERQDKVHLGATAMTERAYDAACATSKQIIER